MRSDQFRRPETHDEWMAAWGRGDYNPGNIEERRDENRWIWHKWSCFRCGAARGGPFAEAEVRHFAEQHMRQHQLEDEDHVRRASGLFTSQERALAAYNARPGWHAYVADDGMIKAEYATPPRRPGWFRRWVQVLKGGGYGG